MKNKNTITVKNPFTNEIICRLNQTDEKDISDIVLKGNTAFRQNKLLAIDRSNILSKVAELLGQQKDTFARSICRETGKPIRESRTEVERAITTITWSAQEALRIDGAIQSCDVTEQRVEKHAYIHRVPLGVIVAITPFNFPLNIPAHKIGPAIAAGNAVIIKPSPRAPLSTNQFVELFYEAGLPENLLNIAHGGPEIIKSLVSSEIQGVTFTGSTFAGKEISKWAAGKKITLELGGNDPVVVMDDADLELAAQTIISHRFGSSGQKCTSCKRAYIHNSIYDEMRGRLIRGISALNVGDPLNEETDIGPLIDLEAAKSIERKIKYAQKNGANLLCGGKRKNAFIFPTLIENLKSDDRLVLEETFGPVLPIFKFIDFQDVVPWVNSTPYGLQSSIFTNRMDHIQQAFKKFDVGALVVNDGPGFRIESLPFGGVKASGIGREGIRYAINEFTIIKTLIL